MTLDELNNLDFNNVGSWPFAAKVLATVLVFVVVIGGGVWLDTRHQIDQLEKIQAEEDTLKLRLSQRAAKAANLVILKQQLEEMRTVFSKLRRQLPSDTEVAALLVDISQTGLASGLEFELFKPQPEIPSDFYAELPIKINVTGSFHEFGAFVSGVAALPRIVTLHDISIAPKAQKGDRLSMTATAKTYRYLNEEEAALSKQKPGKHKAGKKKGR